MSREIGKDELAQVKSFFQDQIGGQILDQIDVEVRYHVGENLGKNQVWNKMQQALLHADT